MPNYNLGINKYRTKRYVPGAHAGKSTVYFIHWKYFSPGGNVVNRRKSQHVPHILPAADVATGNSARRQVG
jgi:hypothetical protein